jgi:hypothetical protein
VEDGKCLSLSFSGQTASLQNSKGSSDIQFGDISSRAIPERFPQTTKSKKNRIKLWKLRFPVCSHDAGPLTLDELGRRVIAQVMTSGERTSDALIKNRMFMQDNQGLSSGFWNEPRLFSAFSNVNPAPPSIPLASELRPLKLCCRPNQSFHAGFSKKNDCSLLSPIRRRSSFPNWIPQTVLDNTALLRLHHAIREYFFVPNHELPVASFYWLSPGIRWLSRRFPAKPTTSSLPFLTFALGAARAFVTVCPPQETCQ